MPEVIGHAPLLLGLLLNNMNNKKEASATAGTVVAHEQIAEADYLRSKRHDVLWICLSAHSHYFIIS